MKSAYEYYNLAQDMNVQFEYLQSEDTFANVMIYLFNYLYITYILQQLTWGNIIRTQNWTLSDVGVSSINLLFLFSLKQQ